MSQYGGYRRGTNDLAYGDDAGGERWDRDRFERMRARSRGARDSDYRFEEKDRFGRGEVRREVEVETRFARRGPSGRTEERDRFVEEDKFTPRRRNVDFFEEDRTRGSGRELAPYRQYEREYEAPVKRAARPSMIRRQSSLDTFDRRPLPRYREEDVDVRLAVQALPRRRREERSEPREEDYRDVRIRRERERSVHRRSDSRYQVSSDSSEEMEMPVRKSARRGITRIPKRLVPKRVVLELGYPFEEEEHFYIVKMVLGKDQIDQVMELSEKYKENRVVYKFEETKLLEAPEPELEPLFYPPPPASFHEEPPPVEIIETVTTKIIENPTPSEIGKLEKEERSEVQFARSVAESIRSPSPGFGSRRGHSRSRHEEIIEREEEESVHMGGPLTLVVPERRHRKERDIKAEIKALEAEKRALKYEREAEEKRRKGEREYEEKLEKAREVRESEYEIVEHKEKDVVRVEKDRRGKSTGSKKVGNGLVAAALATLT